jgi:phosphoenolpyruvate synthase/pyruvate phosphate dikinase
MVKSILFIDGPEALDSETCGNKAYALYKLFREAAVKVPEAFTVTWPALHKVFYEAERDLYTLQQPPDSIIEEIRNKVLDVDLAALPITQEIKGALNRIASNNSKVVARSSSSSEDSGKAAFPGVFESICIEAVPTRVLDAIRRVYASRLSTRAITYARALRARRGVQLDLIQPMAVLVQRYVKSQLGGVVFTVDPTGGPHGRVEIALGGAERIVKGELPNLSMSLSLELGIEPKDKERLTSLVGSAELAKSFQAGLMSAVAQTMKSLGEALDIEWVWDGTEVWIVQARPITRISKRA